MRLKKLRDILLLMRGGKYKLDSEKQMSNLHKLAS